MNLHEELFDEYARTHKLVHTLYVRYLDDTIYYLDQSQQSKREIFVDRWIGRLIEPNGRLVGGCLLLDYKLISEEAVICGNDLAEVVNWDLEQDLWRRCPHCVHAMQFQYVALMHEVFACPICSYATERSCVE